MLKKYAPQSDVQEAYNQLMNLRKSGTVQEFNTKFDLLIARLSLLAEPFRLYHYMHGLKPHLRQSITVTKPKTVEEATNTAFELEAAEKNQIGDPVKKPCFEKKDTTSFKKPFKGGAKSFKKRKLFPNPSAPQDKGKGKFGDKPKTKADHQLSATSVEAPISKEIV